MYGDTIAAISTPLGEGGIGIVRLSGPSSLPLLRRTFVPARPTVDFPSHRLLYGHVCDPESRERLDEVLAAYMRAPATYTREDVVEINCHGGPLPTQRVLALLLRLGARLAEPGEFTLRAFLNGRIDLAQAEAVSDVIRARTGAGLRLAVEQLRGALSEPVRQVRQRLLGVLAYLQATIDFAEDEIPPQESAGEIAAGLRVLEELLRSAEQGIIYRQGVRAAIVGRPNVGKSSLLNALLRTNRAIISPVPGTTRDTVEETLNLRGIPVVLIDTAGLRESDDLVERCGVERARRAAANADLLLVVLDGAAAATEEDEFVLQEARKAVNSGTRAVVLVVNKSDLPATLHLARVPSMLPERPVVYVSSLTGDGMPALEETMVAAILGGQTPAAGSGLVASMRHKAALERAEAHLRSALQGEAAGLAADFIAIDVQGALEALGEITGESVTDDLLERIFSDFCIGK